MITAESILAAIKPFVRIDSHDDHAMALIAVAKLIAAKQASDASLVKRLHDCLEIFENNPFFQSTERTVLDDARGFLDEHKKGIN